MKFKVKQQQDKTIVQALIFKNEELVERELNTISLNAAKNFLRPTLKKRSFIYHYTIDFVGPRSVPLSQYLRNVISKQTFYHILSQIVSVVNYLQTSNMSLKNLVLDFRYIFININTNELFFIYLPLLSNNVSVDMIGFLGTFLHSTNPDRNENNGYLNEFSAFLQTQTTFSVSSFRNYICSKDQAAAAQLKRLMNGQSGFITDKRIDYYGHYGENQPYRNSQAPQRNQMQEEGTTLLQNSFQDFDFGADADDIGTTLLSNDSEEEGTTVLNQTQTYNQRQFPYLIRLTTNERIEINKPVFRLGKERNYVDYFISNNGAVSRSHADIITKSGHYYVMDLHTTNFTYINNSMVPENTEVEIFDGNMLKLANEEFEFHVQ